MAIQRRFDVALQDAHVDVATVDALHVIRHQLAHGADEPGPEAFDAIEFLLDDVTCAVGALIKAPRKVAA